MCPRRVVVVLFSEVPCRVHLAGLGKTTASKARGSGAGLLLSYALLFAPLPLSAPPLSRGKRWRFRPRAETPPTASRFRRIWPPHVRRQLQGGEGGEAARLPRTVRAFVSLGCSALVGVSGSDCCNIHFFTRETWLSAMDMSLEEASRGQGLRYTASGFKCDIRFCSFWRSVEGRLHAALWQNRLRMLQIALQRTIVPIIGSVAPHGAAGREALRGLSP